MSGLVVRAQSNTLPFGFEHIQEQQGLSHSVMSAILRDRDGFLWLGTFEGLNRFDGTHFTVFKSNPDNRRSLGNNRIHALCQDKTGRIWIGTHKGINYFDPANQQITRIDSVVGKPLDVCYNMLCDRAGNIWFTDNQLGLIRYQVQAQKFDLYPISPAQKRKLTGQIPRHGLLEDPNRNGLWIASLTGLNYLDINTATFYNHQHNPDSLPVFTKHHTSAITRDGASQILFSDNDAQRIIAFDATSQRIVKSMQLTGKRNRATFPIGTLFVDRNHNLWTSSVAFTMFFVDAKTGKATEFFHDDAVKTSVAANFFWAAWQHPDGSVWLGTMNGLSITNPDRTFYKIYDLKRFDPSINDYFGISSLMADGDSWWMCTPKYLMRFRPATDQFERYLLPVQEPNDYTPNLPQVVRNPDQNELFIRFRKKIVTFDLARKTFAPLVIPSNLMAMSDLIEFSYIDVHGPYLWLFRDSQGGFRYHLKQRTWEQIPLPVARSGKKSYIIWAASDRQGRYWLNDARNGFLRLNKNQKTFEWQSTHHLSELYKGYKSFAVDHNNNFWMPAQGLGLVQYNPARNSYRVWAEKEGVGQHNYGMGSVDNAGKIWIGFYNRFWVVNPAKNHARSFQLLVNEGEYQYINYFTNLPNGNILASLKGYLVEFIPNLYGREKRPPQMLINSVSTNDTSYLATNASKDISLGVEENTFSIDYSVLASQQANSYWLKLEGYDDKWIHAGSKTLASYTKIPGGDYTFRVKAVDPDFETAEATIRLHIDTEFYNRKWFKGLVFGILIALAGTFWRYRNQQTSQVYQLQMQATRLERDKTDIQYQNLINQLNPHFLFNSLTSLNSLIVTEPKQASRFLQKLSAIYRYILQNKEKETVSLEHELNFVRHYIDLQKSRFDEGLQVELDVAEEYLDRGIVPVTLQNLLENAIKHNTVEDDKPLLIRVFVAGEYLCVENTLQRRKFVETSNKQGLDSLKTLYRYLSDLPIVIAETESTFTVKVPMI